MGGRPRKPTALKELQGTARESRKNKQEPKYAPMNVATPPEYITGEALKCWHRVLPLLMGSRVFTVADYEQFIHYCYLHGRLIEEYYMEKKDPPAGLLGQMRFYSTMFGLDPASRGRIKAGGHGEEKSKFSALNGGKGNK